VKTKSIQKLYSSLEEVEQNMLKAYDNYGNTTGTLHPAQAKSAMNLIHYLSLRNQDIRDLQDALHIHGLSSLASSEGHIRRQVQSILERLGKSYRPAEISKCDFHYGKKLLRNRSSTLFGEKPDNPIPYIMVTFDATFADNYGLIKNLLQNGMNVARINCAHDDETTWSKMIYQIRKACRKTGLECKIYMDLAGPKIRAKLTHKGKDDGKVKVKQGDLIWLAEDTSGFSDKDIVVHPNETGIVECLSKGNRVMIDDGIIKAEVVQVKETKAKLRIVRISSLKSQIKAGKGLNFPDSVLHIPSLTAFDRQCLQFICENADMIGYSFVRYPTDLEILQQSLDKISPAPPHIIIKIETPEAVQNLPALLMQGMHKEVFGVMIARGDLAVEIGFERMGEIQEEILWICEAAHVPVIWATQVLETLNKSGMATRSEITDAAHAAMAECIMINKGDYTIEVIETLRDILARIGGHHIKKRFTFRPLNIARRFFSV
jgi:pyruvate kinase